MRKHFRQLAGFTMIELLVVIAVIGILAVATLSSINPIEQINKGRDTRTRSDASELLSSIERAYSTQEMYPWNIASAANPGGSTIPAYTAASVDPLAAFNSTGNWAFLGSLVRSNEVKSAFGQRLYQAYNAQTAGTETFITLKQLNDDQMAVCFLPVSRQFKMEAAKRCCAAVTADGSICDSAGSLAGVQSAAIGGYTVCQNTTGANWDQAATRNMICLP